MHLSTQMIELVLPVLADAAKVTCLFDSLGMHHGE